MTHHYHNDEYEHVELYNNTKPDHHQQFTTQSRILHINFMKQITRLSHEMLCFVYWSHFAVLAQQSDQENGFHTVTSKY